MSRARTSGIGWAAVSSAASTATAPASTAFGMKARPSTLAPGRAANRKPGFTARLSAAIPLIWGSASSARVTRSERRLVIDGRLGARGLDRNLGRRRRERLGRLTLDAQHRADPVDDRADR